jgi:uncharacterized repeat protein (TIGR04002 family)
MNNTKTKHLCLAAVMAAIIFVFTQFFHIPSHTGYTHIGDAFVYLAGALLPWPYAMGAGAVGAALADILGGYAMWAPASVAIKALTALCLTSRKEQLLCRRNLFALIPALVLCVGGYYGYEVLITGNTVAPLAGIPGYVIQVLASSAVFLVLGTLLDKIHFKRIV